MVLLATLLIVIDPGHTAAEPGAAAANGAVEATRNFEVARVLEATLLNAGATVKMTRGLNDELSLSARAKQAKGSNLFLSIHHDSVHEEDFEAPATSRKAEGFSLHVRADSKESVRIAKKIADALLAAGFKPTPYHATVHAPVDLERGIYDRRKLAVLNRSEAPAVLVECGFISHPEEAARLSEETTRKKLTEAITNGVLSALKAADT